MPTYKVKRQLELVESALNLFIYAQDQWCEWPKLEECISAVDYSELPEEQLSWFAEFIINCCFRVWRTWEEDKERNRVLEKDICFIINNYDWNAFKFARQKGADKETTTWKTLAIDKDNLNIQEIEWLRSKCK